MKLSTKLILGTQCLLAAAVLTFGTLIVKNAKDRTIEEAAAYVVSEEESFDQLIQETKKKIFDFESGLVRKSALNYTIKTKRHPQKIQYVLMSDEDIIWNESEVDVAALMKEYESSDGTTQTSVNWTIQNQNGRNLCIAVRKCDLDSLNLTNYWQAAVFDITSNMQAIQVLMRNSLFIGIAVMIAVFLIESIFIRRVLAPLEALKESAAQIADGNYEKRIPVTNQSDELGSLAVRFNEMAEAIQCQMSELCEERDQQKLLLRAMAHEMRTPITAINGYAFALQSSRLTADQQHEALLCLQEQSKRLAGLSDHLNMLIRAPLSVQLADISSKQVKHQLEQTITPIAKQKQIELSFDWCNAPLKADDSLLHSFFCNLFDNAAKAEASHITIGYDGNQFWVADDGCGMENEEIKNVTRPFYQVDPSRKKEGFGLGLALCERIAQVHGGVLQIQSAPGKGTTVTLKLPLNNQESI